MLLHATSLLTGKEIIDQNKQLYAESCDINKIEYQLSIFSNVEQVDIGTDEVAVLAGRIKKPLNKIPIW